MTSDAEAAARLEVARQRSRAAWEAAAPGWQARRDEFVRLARPISEWLVRRLDPQPGDTVLELAAGVGDTGFMAAPLVGPSGRILCTDFSPRMLEAARARAEELGVQNVEFRTLDAERMELPSDSVDGVICRWGYMLMIDPAAAFAETRRVLRPGGRLTFSVFGAPEQNAWVSLLVRSLVQQGHLPPPEPTAPGILALADPDRIRALVTQAGFSQPEIEEVSFRWVFHDPEYYWRFMLEAAGAISPILQGLTPEAQSAVREHVHEAARPFHAGEGYSFPALCLNVVTD